VKARDAKRMSDLKQVQTALELYYTDQNAYPGTTAAVTTPIAGAILGVGNYACLDAGGFKAAGTCVNAYMGSVPADPNEAQGIHYSYTSNASSTYSVAATLENSVNGLTAGITLSPSGIAD
jgi:type II secretory pathway pseudopilin PulG